MSEALLELVDVVAGYGPITVLNRLSLAVAPQEKLALIGRNGVGKTTLLYTMMGNVRPTTGSIMLRGEAVSGLPPHIVNRRGISIVPEGRRLFGNLSVADNLRLATRAGGASLDEVFDLFPKLEQIYTRRAEHLSGGERQMVAIARALMAPTDLILLDEPFEGLAPTVVQDVMSALQRLKGKRSMILVEHDAEMVLSLADRVYVLVNGRIAFDGTARTLRADTALRDSLLGLAQPSAGRAGTSGS